MNLSSWIILSLTTTLIKFVRSIPIDNGVTGDPVIQCSSDSLSVVFKTQKPFEGRVYVKGFVDQANCVALGKGDPTPSLNLTFTQCGIQRIRQITPPGISVSSTIVISFHKTFVTKVDKAYRVSCFYMEAGKTVSAELEVSMLSTGYVTNQMAMPVCKYEILSGGINGAPLRYAKVGDMVYHKWTCQSDEAMFCMRVHSCSVDDGQGGKPFQVLDAKGCAVDRYVLQNLEYPADLMAGREAHVFKFADKPTLYFNCQMEISIKSPETKNCDSSRPQCPEAGTGAGLAAGINAGPGTSAMTGTGTGGTSPNTAAGTTGMTGMGTSPTMMGAAGGMPSSPSAASPAVLASGVTMPTTGHTGEAKEGAAKEAKEGRKKREVRKVHQRNSSDYTIVGDFDLPRQQLLVLDIEESQGKDTEDKEKSMKNEDDKLRFFNEDEQNLFQQRVCMSPTIFALSLTAVFIVFILIVAFSVKALLVRRSPVKYPKYHR